MGLFKNDKLTFDLDQLESLRKTIESLVTELDECSKLVNEEMTILKNSWQTPAGQKFFQEQDLNWAEELKNYVAILTTLEEMIKFAITTYSDLADSAELIHIN